MVLLSNIKGDTMESTKEHEKQCHQAIRARMGYDLEHYAEHIADAFASSLEDGWTPGEVRQAVFDKLQEWEVNYDESAQDKIGPVI